MKHSTCPDDLDEFDIDTIRGHAVPSTATPSSGGPYAAFTLPSGHVLEFHVPGALRCLIKGPSYATACVFLLRGPDGSVEHSADLGHELPL